MENCFIKVKNLKYNGICKKNIWDMFAVEIGISVPRKPTCGRVIFGRIFRSEPQHITYFYDCLWVNFHNSSLERVIRYEIPCSLAGCKAINHSSTSCDHFCKELIIYVYAKAKVQCIWPEERISRSIKTKVTCKSNPGRPIQSRVERAERLKLRWDPTILN
jgi:hypothetical protein